MVGLLGTLCFGDDVRGGTSEALAAEVAFIRSFFDGERRRTHSRSDLFDISSSVKFASFIASATERVGCFVIDATAAWTRSSL